MIFQENDLVLVLSAQITKGLVGKTVRVTRVDGALVYLEGSYSHWTQPTDALRLVHRPEASLVEDTRCYLDAITQQP